MLKNSYTFEAIGTKWSIETDIDVPDSLKKAIQNKIELFDKTYSRFRDDSLVTQISQEPGSYVFPKDAKNLFNFYKKVYTLTEGKVTPLIGDMVSRAGYDATYSLKARPQKPIVKWEDAMKWDNLTLTTTESVILDFGAAGKGYLIDIIAELLNENSIDNYVIDGSGDLRHKGIGENRVGLEHPLHPEKVIGVVDVRNRSLCASASNRRAWGQGMHHIFDPDKMAPTEDVIATWVIADEAFIADGLATALFFTDPAILRESFDYEFLRMHTNGSVDYSLYFKDTLF